MMLRGLAMWIGMTVGLAAPRAAHACAIKSNDVAIVLGVAGGELVSVRLALHGGDTSADMLDTEWTGKATLHVGTRVVPIGAIDPKANASAEIDRLVSAARGQAAMLASFTPAYQVSATDCSERPKARCGEVSLEHTGRILRVGSVRTNLTLTIDPEARMLVGSVRYRAGKTDIVVANIGTGSAKWSSALRTCDGGKCRAITTLHHGEQIDVAVQIKSS